MNIDKAARIILPVWVFSMVIVIWLSLTPKVEFPIDFWNADKLYHCAAYAWLAWLPMIGFGNRSRALTASLSMILLGVALEIGQYYVPGRTFSFLDMTANGLGTMLGLFAGRCLRKKYFL